MALSDHSIIVPSDCDSLAMVVSVSFTPDIEIGTYFFATYYWPSCSDRIETVVGYCSESEKNAFEVDWKYMQSVLNGELDEDGLEPEGDMQDEY